MSDKKHIIIIRETVMQSWLRDIGTFALFAGLIGLGWLIGSATMQVVGALIAFISIGWRASGSKPGLYTIAEARQRLDQIERGEA